MLFPKETLIANTGRQTATEHPIMDSTVSEILFPSQYTLRHGLHMQFFISHNKSQQPSLKF